jgi:hypothetical protein
MAKNVDLSKKDYYGMLKNLVNLKVFSCQTIYDYETNIAKVVIDDEFMRSIVADLSKLTRLQIKFGH